MLNTDGAAFDTGIGGTRTTNLAGGATLGAAHALKAKLKGLASDLMEWPEDQVTFVAGQAMLKGKPESTIALKDLVSRAIAASGQPIVSQCHLQVNESEVPSYCAQVAEVEGDAETGQVIVHKFVTVHDVGTILNPMGHQGQIEGAIAQGIGQVLIEEMQSEEGRVSTLSLGDYKLPTANDLPELVTVLVGGAGSGPTPYRGKGIGEATISGVAPAIANAVEDALGVRITDLPITAEKVLHALREKQAEGR